MIKSKGNIENNCKRSNGYCHGGDIYKFKDKMLDFSANLNPLGMPEAAKDSIISSIDNFEAYPDHSCRKLRTALSKFYNYPAHKIVCGNGAADLIFRICLRFKPQNALVVSPTFSEYEEAVKMSGGAVTYYPLLEDKNFSVGAEFVDSISEKIDMVFLCSPNNPTGLAVDLKIIEDTLEKMRKNNGLLVIDHCFIHFMEDENSFSAMRLLKKCKDLIIINAFTKIYSMAGLRVGYAFCGSESMAASIQNTLQPWSVSSVAQVAGERAIDVEFIKKTKIYISENRKYLTDELEKIGIKDFPSQCNYLLFKCRHDLADLLEKEGIMIRRCGNFPGLSDSFFRIAVKSFEDNRRLVETIKKVI